MAIIITGARKPVAGELRFAKRLESLLEDDYLCWFDIPVGPARVHPDFVIVHPRRGILVIEVKDWKLDRIQAFDKKRVSLITERGLTHVSNPLEQARQYAIAVKEILEKDRVLLQQGTPYHGRLALPWGYGVAFTSITRRQLEAAGPLVEDVHSVLPPQHVLCQDDLLEWVDRETFQKSLWGMFSVVFPCTLTLPQVDRIRHHLYPEVRVAQGVLPIEPGEATPALPAPDLIRVLDVHQEQLARSLGEGHRVIHGVAGSGKTMILGFRCVHLANVLQAPILVLSFNIALAARLQHAMDEAGVSDRVAVRNFHKWCIDQLRLYGLPAPAETGEAYFRALVESVIRGVDEGHIPRAQYGAILIDEAHDFEPAWLKLAAQMVDPQTNSLLVLYDDAQNLYGATQRRKFSFAEVGIHAQGRTTVLRYNYRNTAEVLAVAYEFAREVLSPEEAGEDGIPLLSPQSSGRHGMLPEIFRLDTLANEAGHLAKTIRSLHDAGTPWADMAVLYRVAFVGEKVAQALQRQGIPFDWPRRENAGSRYRPAEDSVKVLTMHSSKGLEFPIVMVPGLGYMPNAKDDPAAEARLLYVAMTRAMDRLILTCHKESTFVARLEEALERVAVPA